MNLMEKKFSSFDAVWEAGLKLLSTTNIRAIRNQKRQKGNVNGSNTCEIFFQMGRKSDTSVADNPNERYDSDADFRTRRRTQMGISSQNAKFLELWLLERQKRKRNLVMVGLNDILCDAVSMQRRAE